jgi:GntR family transcriptional regulator, negative regulator for fad regulon and positive regulator of fabA
MTPDKERASDRAERQLIEGMLDGTYAPGTDLPGERDLAKAVGVARPALREALQRLTRDGWLDIQQGRPTHVNDYMREGNLTILLSLLRSDGTRLPNFVPNLLEMWTLIAPTYTYRAMEANPKEVYAQLYGYRGLADRPLPVARAQWRLHTRLIELGDNPVYGLILNSFSAFYMRLAAYFFADESRRKAVRTFWDGLLEAALLEDPDRAAALMADFMARTEAAWQHIDMDEMLNTAWDEEAQADED